MVTVRALEILRKEDGHFHEQKFEIEAKIDLAPAQFDRGESLTAEQSRTGME